MKKISIIFFIIVTIFFKNIILCMVNPDNVTQTIRIITADKTVEVPTLFCEQSNVIKTALDHHGWDKSVSLKSLTGEMVSIIAHISAQENIPEQLQPLNLALLDGIKETASFLDIQPLHDHVKDAISEQIKPTANALLNSQNGFLTDPEFLENQYLNIDTLGTLSFDVGTEIMQRVPNLKTWILRSMFPCKHVEDDILSWYTHASSKKHPLIFSTAHDITIEPSDVIYDVKRYLDNLITIEHALLLACIYDAHTKNIPFNFADHPWLSIHFKKLNEDLQQTFLEKGAVLLLPENHPNREAGARIYNANKQIRSSKSYLIIPFIVFALALSSYLISQKIKKEK